MPYLLFDELPSFDEGVDVDAEVPAGAVVLTGVVLLEAVFEGAPVDVAVVRVDAPVSVPDEALEEVESGALVLDDAALDEVDDCANTPAEDLTLEEGEELPD